MSVLPRPLLALGLLLALLVGGCSSDGYDAADIAFANQMVPHHRQAVQMSDVLLGKTGVDDDVRELATTIKGEQAPEIDTMTGWLQDWGAPAPAAGGGMEGMGGSGGMMSQADMDALATAQGKQAQTLFLQGMVGHHEGAIAMATTEAAQGRNGDAKALASSIATSQQAEIDRMKQLLAR